MNLSRLAQITKTRLIVNKDKTPGSDNYGMYYCELIHTEILEDGLLIGEYGVGRTPSSARANYAREIRGKRIVINAYVGKRREFNVPKNLSA